MNISNLCSVSTTKQTCYSIIILVEKAVYGFPVTIKTPSKIMRL